ncbi:perlucin-like protein [Anopheles moucheti]|uniref:perlucin-like protein n=1 Tax=Anopheles moucheti TaxID=186751 RepID=UPI0022F07295|nr:perlucin-like protein [Anopheles moucheti]
MSFKTFFLSLCVLVIAFNCNEAKKSFTAFTKNSTFFEAWQDCHSFNGYLAAIESASDQSLVEEAMAKTGNPKDVYFIGGTDLGRQDRWMWIGLNKQLKDSDYQNFHTGEPNNLGGNQHCLTIGYFKAENRGKWDDDNCMKQRNGYICAFE